MQKIILSFIGLLTIGQLAVGAAETPIAEEFVGEPYDIVAVLIPIREAILSARVDGTVDKHSFQLGERFKEGAVLVYLDDRRATIDLRRAQEQRDFAKLTYDDQKKLYDKKFTSDYEIKKREVELAMAEIALAEAELNNSYCQIKAPFSGRIEEQTTKAHETARAGQPLCRIIDDSKLLAVMNILVTEQKQYPIGTKVKIDLSENLPNGGVGQPKIFVDGVVTIVGSQIDPRSGTLEIRAEVDNQDHQFTAGITGKLVKPAAKGD